MTTLVIVESPKKAKTIGPMLPGDHTVIASYGHIRDLPPRGMGIDAVSFALEYENTERGAKQVAKLKSEAKTAKRIILCTDPDREGEAISWHLAEVLGLDLAAPIRATFGAITKPKVLAALAAPRLIDMNLVRAQEARRGLDRMIGYRVSPALSDRAGQKMGAGRVQSPTTRLIVDREREIASFVSTLHYGAELMFPVDESDKDGTKWKATWDTKKHLATGEKYVLDQALATAAAAVRNVTVTAFEDSERERQPDPAFTTVSLQKAANSRLKFSAKKTMQVAQSLFDQGAITYHRTDSPNIDDEGLEDIAAYAQGAGLVMAPTPRRWKAKDGAQEGHEAIRPAATATTEFGADDDERKLYRLIWQRAVASQLAAATYEVRAATLEGKNGQTTFSYKATGQTLIGQGWMAVYAEEAKDEDSDEDSDEDDGANNPIPALAVDQTLEAISARALSKKTKPPVRYKEGTLIPALEAQGIGRPSTYAAILENITEVRGYISVDAKGYLLPTKLGETLVDALVGRFEFLEIDYTRGLEGDLDLIADGKAQYREVMSKAWALLDGELGSLQTLEITPAHPCPACGKALLRRKSEHGFFWGCIDRECKATLPDNKGKPGERKAPPAPTGIDCPACGKELARRQGVSKPLKRGLKGRPYDFYSCTGFPKCAAKFNTGTDGKPAFEMASA